MSPEVVLFLSPEIVLVAAALLVYMGGAFSSSQKAWAPIAFIALVLAGASLWCCGSKPPRPLAVPSSATTAGWHYDPAARGGDNTKGAASVESWVAAIIARSDNSPVIADPLAAFGRWFALAAGAVMVLMAWRPLATGGQAEYLGSLLLIVAGLMIVSAAANLVLLFVGLELVSIPTYIMLTLGRRDPASQEAATKYFFLSILASAILLYGLSFVYGAGGSMQLPVIAAHLRMAAGLPTGFEPLVKLGMVLVLAGLCYRVTAVPFHFYAPDVYQGTIQANAGLLSVLPKAAGLVVLVRIVLFSMPDASLFAWKLVLALSMLTMTVGNVLALWQDNMRRLLAYSSIANAGYMLIGIAVGLAGPGGAWLGGVPIGNGVCATFFYLCVYSVATLGAFAALAHLSRGERQVESLDELAGLSRTHPAMAAALAVSMFTLAGPLPAGLWGKFLVFGSALTVEPGGGPMRTWFIALAVVAALNAAIAAYYYLRIVSLMYFREPLARVRAEGGAGSWLAAVACALLALALSVYPAPLVSGCMKAGTMASAAPQIPLASASPAELRR